QRKLDLFFGGSVKVDLHCHSIVSDGVLAPAAVAERAHANGVKMWALTDHDELGGLAEARATAQGLGMDFVPGVEISVTWAGHTVHVVGLQIDEHNPDILRGLHDIRKGRETRALEMAARLEHLG